MNEEHVKYFDKQIQAKLEQFPRAIEGKAPIEVLNKICLELRILKDAREHFLYNELYMIKRQRPFLGLIIYGVIHLAREFKNKY